MSGWRSQDYAFPYRDCGFDLADTGQLAGVNEALAIALPGPFVSMVGAVVTVRNRLPPHRQILVFPALRQRPVGARRALRVVNVTRASRYRYFATIGQ